MADAVPLSDASTAHVTLDLSGYITGWSDAATALFGLSAEEAIGQHSLMLTVGDESPAEPVQWANLAEPLTLDVCCRTRDGDAVPAQMTMVRLRDDTGQPLGVGTVYQRRQDPAHAIERGKFYAHSLEDNLQAVVAVDALGRIVMVNTAFTQATGYAADDVVGQDVDLLSAGLDAAGFGTTVKQALQGGGLWMGMLTGRHKSGERMPLSVCVSTIHDELGRAAHALVIFSDAAHQPATNAEQQRTSNFDAVTSLPNRVLLGELLNQTLNVARRNEDPGAVLVVQLQRLDRVYDALGHEAGDAFMGQAAARLRDALREQDILARVSHDKLVVVLPRIRQREHAGLVGQKLLHQLGLPYTIDGHEVRCPATVGIAIYPENGTETTGLLRNAELANQRAIDQGESLPTFFSEEMNQRAQERFRIESELRHALKHGEMLLYHQPKVSLRNGRIVGAEALLRWQHPRHGLTGPARFVPIAEESSLILELGEWVLHEACRQVGEWSRRGLNMPPMAVNLSARQFDKFLPRRLDAMLNLYGVEARQLRLEITESLMVRGADEVISIMNELAAMGLAIALDDFGTGYSSLSYLKKFPISTLKIDRSFVTGIPSDASDCAIARAIVTMGQQLRQEIVAEGVETPEQMAFLRALGCDQLQGYLFSPPVDVTSYERMVRDDRRLDFSTP